tara:strand:- start:27183 stop:27797 length:615 start_codon:yes stop_codon:yes gene_type:complete
MEKNFLGDQIMKVMTAMRKVVTHDFFLLQTHTPNNSEKGQAAIEFLLVFAFAIGVTFLFMSMTINSTQGYMAQYANFMASRTFLTYDNSSNSNFESGINAAAAKARDVFRGYPLEAFDIPENGFEVKKPTLGAASSLFSGTTFQFRKRLTPFKLVGGGSMVTYYAESFLTKEPTRFACFTGTCYGVGQNNCTFGMDMTLFDNGC